MNTLALPTNYNDKKILLHFGAEDYLSWVWINGELVKFHEGGHTPFSVDITHYLNGGSNQIVVKAEDFSRDMMLPKGKQYWEEQSANIFLYTYHRDLANCMDRARCDYLS